MLSHFFFYMFTNVNECINLKRENTKVKEDLFVLKFCSVNTFFFYFSLFTNIVLKIDDENTRMYKEVIENDEIHDMKSPIARR